VALLTVKHEHVADHAKGIARWADRMLWTWSPWHLRKALSSIGGQYAHLVSRHRMLLETHERLGEQYLKLLDSVHAPRLEFNLRSWPDHTSERYVQVFDVSFQSLRYAFSSCNMAAFGNSDIRSQVAERVAREFAEKLRPVIETEMARIANPQGSSA
jgi:hypothetical protein